MRNLAPTITRQRLLIEGLFRRDVGESEIEDYLYGLANALGLKTYGKPIIHSPQGLGSEENAGFDAFIPLIDSGISLYVWSGARFFSTVLYTCKRFDEGRAIAYSQEFFDTSDIEASSF